MPHILIYVYYVQTTEHTVYAKAYSAIRKRKYYASASLIVMAKSRARGIRMYACCGL